MLLIGKGPMPGPSACHTGFAQLRLAHFDAVLRSAGHQVRCVTLVHGSSRSHTAGEHEIVEEGPGWLDRLRQLKVGAEIIVSAGPYNPGRAACLIAEEEPVWADLPGDPFAELQALALLDPNLAAPRIAAAQAAALPVLTRADRISVVSGPQCLAAMGQLGLVGRLADGDPRPFVDVIPIRHDFPFPARSPRTRAPDDPFVVALSGGFNPWFDADSASQALALALDRIPALRVLCTGGDLPGLHSESYARFAAWAEASPHRDRIALHGWLPHAQLPEVLGRAHVGLCLDRPGLEARLGSRTRVLLFSWLGIATIATPKTELVREMTAAELVHPVPVGEPEAVTNILEELARSQTPAALAALAQPWLIERFAGEAIAAPLLAWAASPWRRAPAKLPSAMQAAEVDRLKSELATIHATPTWRTLSRIQAFGLGFRHPTATGSEEN